VTAYAGILGALFHGHGYVPLNPSFPAERSAKMLERAGARALIVDALAAAQLPELLAAATRSHLVVLPDADDVSELRRAHPRHRFVSRSELRPASEWRPSAVDASAIGYLLFTSGSTGQPKGVMVAHRNVTHFVDAMVERYAVDERDRFSQLFDLTFDLSAFDMFVAWERGACVCCPTQKQKLLPAAYVESAGLTIWFSVPSTAVLLHRLRKLAPGAFPKLRLALFCGEALPAEITRAFAAAAPAAIVENLYGPTELTIACTLYRWDPDRSPGECEQGLVPIGAPYPGMRVRVADEELREVAPGEAGELLMTGPQLSLGYLDDPERTRAAFVTPPGADAVYYRTGDRVRRPVGDAPLCYLGRVDNQIKIQGYRVELGEVEAVLRELAGVEVAIAVGWPRSELGVEGIVAFIGAGAFDADAILARVAERLPVYMRPRELRSVVEFPLNANGKVDRGALLRQLERERAGEPVA
jgi:amino acid adenylation domain-containing protein